MTDANFSPIYKAQSQIRNHDVDVTIHDFDGTSDITLTADDGEEITIPSKFLDALGSVSHQTLNLISEQLDVSRRSQHHPSSMDYSLSAIRRQHTWSSSQPEFRGPVYTNDEARFATWTCFCLADKDPNEDGIPYIEWMYKEESQAHGWALRLSGVKDMNISWAAWNDPDAIRQNLEMLNDPDSCVVVAGIVNAEATSQMTARKAAKALRSGRKLPGINMKKVKAIFNKYESILLPEDEHNSFYNSPTAKIVSLPSGDKRVPVAVAVAPPHSFPNQEKLTIEQRREMAYTEIEEFEKKAYESMYTPWAAQLVSSFESDGWRAIDLPIATRYSHFRSRKPTFFTLIPENIWTDVSAGVINFTAREFDMSRSTSIEKTSFSR